jgi:IS30 family transposase
LGAPTIRRDVERVFWRLVGQGLQNPAAAEAAGVSVPVGWRWFVDAGGMPPLDLGELSGRYLSFVEREEIAVLRAQRLGVREIARRLGRSPSTISRELRRNAATRSHKMEYRASTAQWHCERRARRPKVRKLDAAANERLREYVQDKLTGPGRWSPEQIAARLLVDFPDDEAMRVSHETIYRSIYVQGRGALRRELVSHLRTGRTLRKPRRREQIRGKRPIPPEILISQRPAEIEDRAVPGHWEGDLIVGSKSSVIGTLVERKTRYLMLLHLPRLTQYAEGERGWAGRGAEAVREAITTTITTLPEHLRQSLTWDQGIEMWQHAQLRIDTNIDVYFCDPHSPWQRGTNENTNGLLRQYFPKSSDLSAHTPDDLQAVAHALNSRPRKTLGWKTPAEALTEELLSPTN